MFAVVLLVLSRLLLGCFSAVVIDVIVAVVIVVFLFLMSSLVFDIFTSFLLSCSSFDDSATAKLIIHPPSFIAIGHDLRQ